MNNNPDSPGGFAECPISPRLEEVAVQIRKGESPNFGRFCGNCYTPLSAERERCTYCGIAMPELAPVESIPLPVIEIVRAKRGRESWIVNSFAYTGLLIGTIISIWLLLALPGWWRIFAFAFMLLGTRGLAAVLGGWIGDSIGYRSATALVADKWAAFVRQRDSASH